MSNATFPFPIPAARVEAASRSAWSRVLCLALLLVVAGFAQERVGSIVGTVTDPSGAAIPGAQVTITSATAGNPQEVTADAAGKFQLLQLPAGLYNVSAASAGFASMQMTSVPVELGRATRVELKLEVGQVTERVDVAANAIIVDSQSSASAVVVDRSFSDLLPKGRSFYDLVAIAPGARPETKTGGVQVDGASGAENTYYLDGMEVTSIQTGVLNTQSQIPVEMVEQTQIKNGVMDAQYGGAMGGVINAVLRSGSNDFHGSMGFYYENDVMSARSRPFLQLDLKNDRLATYRDLDHDSYTEWNPVFTLGGPIVRNKLFFFSAYTPRYKNTDRPTTYQDDSTGISNSSYKQHYMVNKLDYAVTDQVRTSASWIWNPYKRQGDLTSRLGTSSPGTDWEALGEYDAGNMIAYSADYTPTSRMVLSFRGGYHFSNRNTNYGIPSDTSVYYSNQPPASLGLPASLIHGAGWLSYAPGARFFDAYKRQNYNADISYIADWFGQHTLKGGWQMNRLANQVNSSNYANGYYRYWWNSAWTCQTSQCSGTQRGAYGYYRYLEYGEFGDVSSNNQGFFLQDSWRMNRHLTLSLGLRTEREIVPSFSADSSIPSTAIEFPWSDKWSPRLGFAFDPVGDGKTRIYGAFGYYYDIMKYELPRGSFGGNVYMAYIYALDDPNLVTTNQGIPADPRKLPGRFIEAVNYRIPSNDPSDNTIDPDLKPMKMRLFDFGLERMLSSSLVASVRYTNRRLIRTIEDVGTVTAEGERYYIANPGFGVTADPANWDTGIPVTPKAKREYDGLEVRLDKRFSDRYQFSGSYTWSRQYGNYSGLSSSDEVTVASSGDSNGRVSPNVNRYFDLPWIYYTEQGTNAEGLMATDRPHTFKLFGLYNLENKLGVTTFAPRMLLYSGTPLTTEINAFSVPLAPYGRGDLGRTPVFFNTDFNVAHEFRSFGSAENLKLRLEMTVFNLFNGATATSSYTGLGHENDANLYFDSYQDIFKGFNTVQRMAEMNAEKEGTISRDPRYGLANSFQSPRSLRFQVSFVF